MKPSVRTKIILALMLLPLGELHSLSAWAENAPVLACSRGEDFTLHANGARFEETALVYKNGNRVEQLVESFASRAMDGPAQIGRAHV